MKAHQPGCSSIIKLHILSLNISSKTVEDMVSGLCSVSVITTRDNLARNKGGQKVGGVWKQWSTSALVTEDNNFF